MKLYNLSPICPFPRHIISSVMPIKLDLPPITRSNLSKCIRIRNNSKLNPGNQEKRRKHQSNSIQKQKAECITNENTGIESNWDMRHIQQSISNQIIDKHRNNRIEVRNRRGLGLEFKKGRRNVLATVLRRHKLPRKSIRSSYFPKLLQKASNQRIR